MPRWPLRGVVAQPRMTSGNAASIYYVATSHNLMGTADDGLDKLTGPDKLIKITACESTQTNDVLRVLRAARGR